MDTIWTIEKVEELIRLEVEESMNLEFKSAGALSKSDPSKKEISKDVAAFANSDGGTIIYGLEEKNHAASSLSGINGNLYTKEWLEHIINSNIQQKIRNIKITPIRINNNVEESLYIVEIPRSDSAPHMSKDKRYYKRYNFECVPMEEYEVRRLYNSEKRTILEIGREEIGKTTIDTEPDKIVAIDIRFEVRNIGNVQEDNFKLQVQAPTITYLPMEVDHDLRMTNHENGVFIYSTYQKMTLFPGESQIIGSVIYNFQKHSIDELNIDEVITATLFYSSGTVEKKISLKEVYQRIVE